MAIGVSWRDPDVVKGLAVGVLLIAAMTGLFFYERAQFGEYPLEWTTASGTSASESGSLTTGESARFSFEITDANLLRVVAVVTWTDDVGDPDTFEVELAGPEGAGTVQASDSSGSIEAAVDVNDAPSTDTAPGRDPDDAGEQAAALHASSAGQGTWTATITLVSAPGQTLPAAGAEVTPDGSNDFTLTVTAEVYEPRVGAERV